MNQKELHTKIVSMTKKQREDLGLSEEEFNFITKKIKHNKLGLQLNFTEVDEGLSNNYYVFKENKELGINVKENEKNNLLIEGDNYHALRALQVAGTKVDVIYIDPPYNTGKEFIYNDSFVTGKSKVVGGDDPHKHSKWLSFMKKRLILAKELLTDEGVIFVSIDDNEQAYLKVLMDEIFGEKNFIANIPRKLRNGGKNDSKFFRKNMDYLLCYSKSIEKAKLIPLKLDDENYTKSDSFVQERGKYQTAPLDAKLSYSKSGDFPFVFEGKTYYPGGKERYDDRMANGGDSSDYTWRWSKELFQFAIDNDLIVISGNKIRYKVYFNSNIVKINNTYQIEKINRTTNPALTNFTDSLKYSSQAGSDMLKNLGLSFDAPKSVDFIKDILKFFSKNKSTILDFFAGSGTTGQAVMELNKEDKGNRRFILITNNENNIARDKTNERLHRVINGVGSKGEEFKWMFDSTKNIKSLNENSVNYLELEEVNKVSGDYEQIDSKTSLYETEFNKSISIEDFE